MEQTRSGRAWTVLGVALLVLSVVVLAGRAVKTPITASEEMRDAVAAPVSPALLGAARVVRPDAGWFASPAGRRAEAERALLSSRPTKSARSKARAAKMRREAAERALAVTAQ